MTFTVEPAQYCLIINRISAQSIFLKFLFLGRGRGGERESELKRGSRLGIKQTSFYVFMIIF